MTGKNGLIRCKDAGVVRVEAVCAQNLPAAVMGSLMRWTPSYSNAFCVIKLAKESFQTKTQFKTLNPLWKETGQLTLPMPSEQEILQTFASSSSSSSSGSSSQGNPPRSGGQDSYRACFPELHVQMFHELDDPASQDNKASTIVDSSSSPDTEASSRKAKLIGEAMVSVLPCILSNSSNHRAWYTLYDDEDKEAGQIQLDFHYDPSGMDPAKHDFVRVIGFGGLDYYSKVLPPTAWLEVVEVYRDQVMVQCKSREGWNLTFELPRNLVQVVRRPSLLKDAQVHIQDQISRVRRSSLYMKAEGLWLSLPENRRSQATKAYNFGVFSTNLVYDVICHGVSDVLDTGVVYGAGECIGNTEKALKKGKEEFVRVFWNSPTPPPQTQVEAQKHGDDDDQDKTTLPPLESDPEGDMATTSNDVLPNDLSKLDFDGPEHHKDPSTSSNAGSDEDVHGDLAQLDLNSGAPLSRHHEEEEKETSMGRAHSSSSSSSTTNSSSSGRASNGSLAAGSNKSSSSSTSSPKHKKLPRPRSSIPEQLICPITGCTMVDPVVAADGHSYDREAILQWLATSNKSPMTGMAMATTQVFPNFTLRKLLDEFQDCSSP